MNYVKLLGNFFRLRGNVKKTRAEIASIQERKLRKMLFHAWDHSPYYRRKFERAGILREQIAALPLSAFPTMEKTDLLAHFDELVTAGDLRQEALRRFDEQESERRKAFLDKYHVVHSSGSTGKPGYFVYDEAAWNEMLLGILRGALWGMSAFRILRLLAAGPRIVYIAATDGRYGGAMAVGDGIDGVHARQLFLDVKTPLAELARQVRDFDPNMIIGYPSAIKILGELKERGEIPLNVFRVISCGEPLGAGMRDYLEKTFHADVINFYGASESLALGVETGHTGGMVLFDDMNVIEVEDGNMYLTSLYNFTQPLIRYRLSDQLVLMDEKYAAPFTRAEILMGREEDLLWFRDGKGGRDFLHPLAIEGFCIEGLRDFQFRQTGEASFEMLAEVSGKDREESVRKEMLRLMGEILREKGLGYVRFSIRFVSAIRPDPKTGKKKLIVKKGPPEEEIPLFQQDGRAWTAGIKKWELGNAV